jgi:ATP-dependent Clp protease, protease subunit
VANSIIAQLLFLQMDNREGDIHIYLNSPGGSITAGLAILDTMQFIKCKVKTYCVGTCSNIAALLLSSGSKGFRFALPHSRVVLYQPTGSLYGQASDILIASNEIKR